jgi:hypothetical protein
MKTPPSTRAKKNNQWTRPQSSRFTFRTRNHPRNIRKSKLDRLPPRQLAALKRWLFKDGLTYSRIVARLFDEFGVKTNVGSICRFWQKHSAAPTAAQMVAQAAEDNKILLDVVLQSSRPIRLRIIRNQLALATQVKSVNSQA